MQLVGERERKGRWRVCAQRSKNNQAQIEIGYYEERGEEELERMESKIKPVMSRRSEEKKEETKTKRGRRTVVRLWIMHQAPHYWRF